MPDLDTQTRQLALYVSSPDGKQVVCRLKDNSNVFIGAGSSCGIRLEGLGIEDLHCMLIYKEGELSIRDWHTSGQTFVNGDTVVDEVSIRAGDQLLVGDHRIDVRETNVSGDGAESEANRSELVEPSEVADRPTDEISDEDFFRNDDWPKATSTATDTPGQTEDIQENRLNADPLKGDPLKGDSLKGDSPKGDPYDDSVAHESPQPVSDDSDFFADFAFDPDAPDEIADKLKNESDVETMRSELDRMRMELSQRDSELDELRSGKGSEQVDDETTVRLVNRLEDLLEELENSDKRVLELEQVLRVSDEATQAEREERGQLESWVKEIEQRVSTREAEFVAEAERLQRKLDESNSELSKSQFRLQELTTATSNPGQRIDSAIVAQLNDPQSRSGIAT